MGKTNIKFDKLNQEIITYVGEYNAAIYYNSGFFIYFPNKVQRFNKNQTEELVDFICGNQWPEEMNEFFSLVLQRIKPL